MGYLDTAIGYANDILSEKIPASRNTRLMCQRFARDVERSNAGKLPWVFNEVAVDRFCAFAESFPLTSGGNLCLQPWQVFIFANIFGWVEKCDLLTRRFREAFVFVPRKNGKSTMASLVGLYMLTMDGERAPQVFAGATSKEQARIVFREASNMTLSRPDFMRDYHLMVRSDRIIMKHRGVEYGRFGCLIGKPGDGDNPHCAIIDEYHEHKSNTLFDAMKFGAAARKNSLMFIITTAGTNPQSVCHQYYDDCCRLLRSGKGYANDRRFVAIWEPDQKLDWKDERAIRQANPNLDVTVRLKNLLHDQKTTKTSIEINAYKTKHLNIWTSSTSGWDQAEALKELGDAPPLEEWKGQPCCIGADLASVHDFSSWVAVFRKEDAQGKTHYYAYDFTYHSEDVAHTIPEIAEFIRAGEIRLNPGNEIDQQVIETDVVNFSRAFHIKSFGYDIYKATPLIQRIEANSDTPCTPVKMYRDFLDEPIRALSNLIDLGRFHYRKSALFCWEFGNVALREQNGLLNIAKKAPGLKRNNKIDTAVATIIAMQRWCETDREAQMPKKKKFYL